MQLKNKNKKIVFSGGGTLGSVTPLLAMKEMIVTGIPEMTFVWVGTKRGPERRLIEHAGIPFTSLSSGKFRRYVSILNVTDFIRIVIGFFQSLFLLLKEKPDICISAGGFISVPLHWAAWVLRIPTWIHQQDVVVGLANKLMTPSATLITTALEESAQLFPKKKTLWLGNPIRQELFFGSKDEAIRLFGLSGTLPVVLVLGGGTGSQRVNELVAGALPELEGKCEVIHLSGLERPQSMIEAAGSVFPWYHPFQFLGDEMKHAYAAADIIIARAGFGTLSEIAALGKPAILVPKEGHQEENVKYVADRNAAVYVNEVSSDGLFLASKVKELLNDEKRRNELGSEIKKILPAADNDAILRIIQLNVREM